MADADTLGILEELQALVVDKLQVVSYKWLSRNFLISSNTAKRLLQQFIETHDKGLEVVYALSGWLKNNPSVYHIQLVSRPKLDEAKQDFDENSSIQIYSVQACIPKDPVVLWNAEFVQAEELFKQSLKVDNCLRDNRFCGILNSFVKRNTDGTPVRYTFPQPKNAETVEVSKSSAAHQTASASQTQQYKVQQSRSNINMQSSSTIKDVKNVCLGDGSKLAADNRKANQLPPVKKDSDKNSSGSRGSLANMWGRASVKPKSNGSASDTNGLNSKSSDAQICASEAVEDESGDDDAQDVNFRRTATGEGSRKRRVVFDFSDEEDEHTDAVNLASPELPKKQISLDLKTSSKTSDQDKNNFNLDNQTENKLKAEEENEIFSKKLVKEDCSTVAGRKNTSVSSSNIESSIPETDTTAKSTVTAPNSPKRRKVIKTRIDERGREVTEVVWEVKEEVISDTITTKKVEAGSTVNSTVTRHPASKKAPAVGTNAPSNQASRGGNKKAGNKDPKQGNILSFFKKA